MSAPATFDAWCRLRGVPSEQILLEVVSSLTGTVTDVCASDERAEQIRRQRESYANANGVRIPHWIQETPASRALVGRRVW